MDDKELSKVISHALRHQPQKYNVELSKDGWVAITDLVNGIRDSTSEFSDLTEEDIITLVTKSDKKRHEVFEGQIRALYGHSLEVENELENMEPPTFLYHATSASKYIKIQEQGLKPMERQFVHLTVKKEAARDVALKKYKNIILLEINALKAFKSSISFYSNNKDEIWLCKHVPSEYLRVIEGKIVS